MDSVSVLFAPTELSILNMCTFKMNKQRKNNVRGVSSHLTLHLLLREKDSLETEFRAMISLKGIFLEVLSKFFLQSITTNI